MSTPYRNDEPRAFPAFERSSVWQSYVGLSRLFLVHAVLGTLFMLVLYPPAIYLILLLMSHSQSLNPWEIAFLAGLVSVLVSGVCMLVYAFRIRAALQRCDLPRESWRSFPRSAYFPWSAVHYSVIALVCFALAFVDTHKLNEPLLLFALPGLYCLFALFCSFNLWSFVRKLRERETARDGDSVV
jgi:hypothetical protein